MATKKNDEPESTYDQLLSQYEALSEELHKCKQDKEFVWKLWKELQGENPDTTNLINKVIEREQEKSDAKDLKVLMILEQKDKQINVLQDVSADLQGQVGLLNTKVADVLLQVTDWQNKAKVAEDERNRLKSELDYKDELLKTKEKQLMLAESGKKEIENRIDEKNLHVENSRKEMENKVRELAQENSLYQNNIDMLNEKLEIACIQSEDLKEEFKTKDNELNVLTSKLDDEVQRNAEVMKENEEHRSKIKKLKEAFARKSKEVADRNLEIQSDQIKNNKKTIRELSRQLDECNETIQHLQDEIRSYEHYPKQIKEQVQLIKSLEKLQDETQHVLSQQEVTHQQETNTLQNCLYEMKACVAKLQKEAAAMMTENKTLKKKISKLEHVNESFQEKENSLQQELISISLELESFKNKANKLAQEKNNKEKCINSMVSEYTQTVNNDVMHCDNATQTEECLATTDELELSSLKVKRKKEKLHTETQRLLTLKSEINQENRALKKRIFILESQCNQLQDEKTLMEENTRQLCNDNENLNCEISASAQKLETITSLLQSRTAELEECTLKIEAMSDNHIKGDITSKNLSSKLKMTEEELQVATSNCSKLSFQLKTLCGENEILMEKQKSFQERITKQDRLLNQKKILIDELKGKYNEAKNESEKDKESIGNINTKLKTVSDRENKDKVYIEKLKTKLDDVTKEKCGLQELLGTLKSEIENKNQFLHETQQICHQAEAAITSMEKAASQQIEKEKLAFKGKEEKLKSCYNKSVKRVGEFIAVIKNLAESLLLQIHEKRIIVQKFDKPKQSEKKDKFKKKACDVACSILNMSSADLEEFMAPNETSDKALKKYEDTDIREKLELILGKKDNFEDILTHFMLDIVEYYLSLCIKETTHVNV